MSLTEQYIDKIKPEIDAAIEGALPTMTDHLCEWIYQMSWDKVYSYPAAEPCLSERRHRIGGRENLEVTYTEQGFSVKNITEMQFDDGPPEVDVVEQGMAKYNQDYPGPRPFMEPARDWFMEVDADDDIANALRAAGFEVEQSGGYGLGG